MHAAGYSFYEHAALIRPSTYWSSSRYTVACCQLFWPSLFDKTFWCKYDCSMAGVYLSTLFHYAWGVNLSLSFSITSLTGMEITENNYHEFSWSWRMSETAVEVLNVGHFSFSVCSLRSWVFQKKNKDVCYWWNKGTCTFKHLKFLIFIHRMQINL